jgi:hypothetical protein
MPFQEYFPGYWGRRQLPADSALQSRASERLDKAASIDNG